MRLVAFSLAGYRRFVAKTSVKLHGDMIAFVGPNEAGTSSVLRALAHLHKEGGFDANERPRRPSLEPRLAWHFQLEDQNKAALPEIPDSHEVRRANEDRIARFEDEIAGDEDRLGQLDRALGRPHAPSAHPRGVGA